MQRTWRHLVGRLSDGLPESRYEAVLAVLRGSVLVSGGLALLVESTHHDRLLAPFVVNLVLGIVSLAAAVPLSRVSTAERARTWGAVSTVVDLLVFAAYSAAFADRPSSGAFFGVFVLVEGPVRYGLRGALLTGVPVAATALAWPQQADGAAPMSALQVVLLCLVFTLPAVAVRAMVLRGGARLRQAEQQFATAFEHASIGMALTDRDLHVLQANRSLGVLLGESPAELLGSRLDLAVDRTDRAELQAALRGLAPQAPSTRLEVRLRRPDGGLRWGHVSASLLAGSSGVSPRIVVQVENITERKRSEAMLSHAAAHDALTDLPNRNLLLARLDAALQHGEQVGVLFLDLDRFKVVNDGLGHAAGDLLLVQVAIRLRDAMRPDDMVARLGGDEFVVLCRQADEEAALAVAQRVLGVLSQPLATSGGGELVVGASIGIALAGPGDTAELVLRDADTAMYAAKDEGGGRLRVFTPDLRDAAVRVHELEVELRAAVRADQLRLVYQPVIDLATGLVHGCEALVRWDHPRRGPVGPAEFVPVAEQSDLILELGDWVLRRALADAATWLHAPDRAPVTVAVNVSIRQLNAPGFAEHVRQVLLETGTEPSRLCLEVTETVLAGDVEPIVAVLERLRDVGVRLSIDDFGTGHASLTYLARFPVDQVKVDQSFVAGLGADAGSGAIVGGVVAMAHTFDLRVVAEGVETQAQLEALRDVGCDAVQGYLLGRPVGSAEVAFTLRRQAMEALLPAPREGEGARAAGVFDEERAHRLLVDGLKEVAYGVTDEASLESLFAVLRRGVSFTGASIMVVDEGQVRIAAALPTPTPEALAARIPLGQGVSGTLAMTGEPRYLPDITIASTVTANRRSTSSSTGVRSWYGVPLLAEGRPVGVLQVDSTSVDAFDEADRLAVLSFAPVVTLALLQAQRQDNPLRAVPRSGPA